jgi:hypothetical protein
MVTATLAEEIVIASVKPARSAVWADTVHRCSSLMMAGPTNPLMSNSPKKMVMNPP